jgi:pimeloyl-ACP methyl ester carboxylesterase
MGYLQNFKYDIFGDPVKPKLVFLHGVMGSGANWRKITPYFTNNFCVLTFDQRGHGRSFKPMSGYAPEDYAYDLKEMLNELGWHKIHLVGHSMGGRNALAFAHLYPDKLEALVIEDIGPEGNHLAMDRTLRLIESVPTPFPSQADAKEFFASDFLIFVENHPQKKILPAYFYTNIESKPDGTADWRFFKDGILQSLRQGHFAPRWDYIKELKARTLFVRGETSEDFTSGEFERVLASNPKIQGATVMGSGHWVHFDKPKEFSELVLSFLTS